MKHLLLLLVLLGNQALSADVVPISNQKTDKKTIKNLTNKELNFKTSIKVDNIKKGDSICIYRNKDRLGCSPISEDPSIAFKRPDWNLFFATFAGSNYLLPAIHINKKIAPRISLGLAPFLTFSGLAGNSQSTLGIFFTQTFYVGSIVDMSSWIVQTAFSYYRINLNLTTGAEKITSFGGYLTGGYTLASESGLSLVLLGGFQYLKQNTPSSSSLNLAGFIPLVLAEIGFSF